MPSPLAALIAAAALAAVPAKGRNAPAAGQRPAKAAASSGQARGHAAKPREGTSALARARAQLAAVKRDPAKRRYPHHWERAIRSLERAATGKDRAVALHEAARARYALYRISAIEADCPGVSRDMIRLVLRQLRDEGIIEVHGRGRAAKWATRW